NQRAHNLDRIAQPIRLTVPRWDFALPINSLSLHSSTRMMYFALMLVGTGIDLVEMGRIAKSIERFGDRFLTRIFTRGEIAYCQAKKNSAESFAARFAAKEAGAKALGTGIQHGIAWKELEVRREPGQRPNLHFTGRAREIAAQLGVRHISLSLTHSTTSAIA